MNKIMKSTKEDIRTDIPQFRSGDTLNIGVKVVEGDKSRVQNFEGVVIAKSARRTALLPTRKNTIVAAAIIKNIIAAVLSISCNVNPILFAD